jgi:hypothetical protein
METVGPSPLGELLGLSRGSPAWTGGTSSLTMLGVPFMSFTRHDLQGEARKIEWDHDRNAAKQEMRVLGKIND